MSHKTVGVARLLGVNYQRLWNLIRSGRLDPPRKDESGDYVWDNDDIDRARAALSIDRRRIAYRHAVAGVAHAN
jgi:hypothetical protein